MNILLIAYYFPPDASSGAFRPLYFARYFKKRGEQVTMLTAREQDFLDEQPRDPELVPGDMEILRTRVFRPREMLVRIKARLVKPDRTAGDLPGVEEGESSDQTTWFQRVKDFITTALASPDAQAGWLLPGIVAGRKMIREKKTDLILATGGPWTGLAMGAVLKWMTGCPLVLDFRDPWVSNPNFLNRPALIRKIEAWMERQVLRQADLVVANTEELKQDFLGRHSFLSGKVETVPNGFERSYPATGLRNPRFTLTHAGNLYLSRNPVHLVRAVLNLVTAGKISRDNFKVNFVGGMDIADPELDRLLAAPGMAGIISVIPRVTFDAACQYQQESDLLFLLQPDFPLQVPRKLYEYMAFGKPVLAISEETGATARVVKETRVGQVVENSTTAIEKALETYLDLWQDRRLPLPEPKALQAYANEGLCRSMHRHLIRRFGPGIRPAAGDLI